jgi:hypothetical protein
MRRKLLLAGLILFPLTGLFCLFGGVMVQVSSEGHPDYFETAVRYSRIYLRLALLSALAFIACLIALITSARRRSRFK